MTLDLAALALHEPYIASNNVIIGDGSCLSITHIGSFSLTSLPTPLLFNNVLHVSAISKTSSQFLPFMPITLLISYFFTLFFRYRIVTQWSLWFMGNVEMVSITDQSPSLFSLSLWFCPLRFCPYFLLYPCGIVVSVIRPYPFFTNFFAFYVFLFLKNIHVPFLVIPAILIKVTSYLLLNLALPLPPLLMSFSLMFGPHPFPFLMVFTTRLFLLTIT